MRETKEWKEPGLQYCLEEEGGPLQVHDGERQGLGSGTGCFLWHRVGLEVDFPIIIGYLGLVIIPRTKQVLLTPEMALERCLARFSPRLRGGTPAKTLLLHSQPLSFADDWAEGDKQVLL